MRRSSLLLLVVLLISSLAWPAPAGPAHAGGPDGVVGDGTADSCTYAELNFELGAPGYITFACGAAPKTIILQAAGGMAPLAGQATTLDGGGLITLSADHYAGRRLFSVGATAALTLTHMALTSGVMNAPGGALYNSGRLTLVDVVVDDSTAQTVYGGGAIYNTGILEVRASELRHNYSAGGGAIFNDTTGRTNVAGSTIFSNTVGDGYFGGGILNYGILTVTTSLFRENRHEVFDCASSVTYCGGGGIANLADGRAVISATTFSGNFSDSYGSALLNRGDLSLAGSTLTGNRTLLIGTVSNVMTATAVLTDVVISHNAVGGVGGFFNQDHSSATLTDVTIAANHATGAVGGFANGDSIASLSRVTISGNSATSAALEVNSGFVTVDHGTISGNMGATAGGVHNAGTLDLQFVTIYGNVAYGGGYGGGIHNETSLDIYLFLKNVIIAGNSGVNCAGQPANSIGYSLTTDTTCFTTTNDHNQPNTAQLLGPLANNGGPTLTHMPAPGSPAVNGGECSGGYAYDQRGQPREVGPSCDIGAVERQLVDYGWYLFLPLTRR